MKIRNILELPLKAEIMALHIGFSIGAFFMVLPSLNSETSGSKKGPLLKVWEKGFRLLDTAFSRFQVGQMKVLHKLGLLRDDEFIGKRLDSYFHNLHARDAGPEARVDTIIAMNKSGFISDTKAAMMLGGEGHSSDFSFSYDPAKKSFNIFGDVTDAQDAGMNRAWDKMIGWGTTKAEQVASLKGKARNDFASALVYMLDMTPLGSTENEVIAIGPRSTMQHSLSVIFKEAVTENGEPLAASAFKAGSVSQLSEEMKNGEDIARRRQFHPDVEDVVHAAVTAQFLDTFAARNKAVPKP